MYGSNCKGAEVEGVSILHGNRGVYHDNKQPAFKVVYDAIRDVSGLGDSFHGLDRPARFQAQVPESGMTLWAL